MAAEANVGQTEPMAIIIREIHSQSEGRSRAVIEHRNRRMTADIAGNPSQLRYAVGTELLVEIDYGSVRRSRILHFYRPSEHGLYQEPSGGIRVVGRVHNVLDISETEALVDIYLQTGPEFLCVKASEFASRPRVDVGVEVLLDGLCFHPTSWVSVTSESHETPLQGDGPQGDGD